MREFLLILLMSISIFAAGGDTLEYDAGVEAVADGDTMFVDIWYHPLKDSIQSIINGRLGNINLAADANIALTKLDTSTTITKLKADTIEVDTITTTSGIDIASSLLKVDNGAKRVSVTGPADDTEIFSMTTNSKNLMQVTGTQVTFNQTGDNVDFKIESDDVANFVFLDAEENMFTITGPSDNSIVFNVITNSKSLVNMTGTDVIFNEGGNQVNFRIEGDTKPNLFKTWAVGDSVTVDGRLNVDTVNFQMVNADTINTRVVKAESYSFDTITVANGISSSLLNTGHGANELYAMNQDVETTDDVVFDSITVANNISVNGNSLMFEQGQWYATYTGFSGTVQDTIRYTIIGNVVTLYFDYFVGTSNANSFAVDTAGVPAVLYPSFTVVAPISGVTDNSGTAGSTGCAHIKETGATFINIGLDDGVSTCNIVGWTTSNNKGFLFGSTLTYYLQ